MCPRHNKAKQSNERRIGEMESPTSANVFAEKRKRKCNLTKAVRQVRGVEVQTDQTEILIALESHGSKAEATKEGIVTPGEGTEETTCLRGVAPTAEREAQAKT
jgi:hypothetical protein